LKDFSYGILIDADLPNSTVEPFHEEGFEAVHVREVDLGTVRDEEVSAYAGMRPTAFPVHNRGI
jgi:predicted nuclease of predicted toxin-antitoxin system